MFVNQIKTNYLTDVLVKMRIGGQSNSSLGNRLRAHREDYLAWKLNGVSSKWYTLLMKPARKIKQFIFTNIEKSEAKDHKSSIFNFENTNVYYKKEANTQNCLITSSSS